MSLASAAGDLDEYSLTFARDGQPHLLVLPAWFDEANKTRHFTVELMRRLHAQGWAVTLPDLPGCNESLASLAEQDLETWRTAAAAWAEECGASYCLAIRAGAALVPDGMKGWRYAPLTPKSALRALLRAGVLAAREAGGEESSETLLEQGLADGLDLAGYSFGSAMLYDLAEREVPLAPLMRDIPQGEVGGGALWLRAEPDFDAVQCDRLATIIGAPGAA